MNLSLNIWLTILLAIFFSTHSYAHHLTVSNARIHEGPPSQKVLAAYLTLNNNSDSVVEVVTLESPLFERIEIHQTIIENDVAKMQQIDALIIEPHSMLELSPGAQHLMMISPTIRITAGTTVPVSFTLADGNRFELDIPVVKSHNDHTHHHHH